MACKAQLNVGMTVGYPHFEFKTTSLYEVTAATLLLCGCIFTSPARTRLWHRSLGSKQTKSSMAEKEESAMEEETNITSNVTSDMDTEAEPQEAELKIGNWISIVWLWFGIKNSDTSQTTWICKTCRQQVVTSNSNTCNLFYHLKTRHEKQYRDRERMWQSTNITSKPQSDEIKKKTPNKPESLKYFLFTNSYLFLTVLHKDTNKRRKCHSFAFHSNSYQN